MTYGNIEDSRYLGQPVDLLFFRYGTAGNAYFAYTDSEEPVDFDGVTYAPIPLDRDIFQASGTLDKSDFKVRVPINSGVADLFRVYPPGQVVNLTVRQGHLSDPDAQFLVIWTGRVVQSNREGDSVVELTCQPVSTSLRRSGLRRNYQLSCPHLLYGGQCKASQVAGTISSPITSSAGNEILMPLGWNGAYDPAKFVGGMAIWSTVPGAERRTILRVENTVRLKLTGPTTGLLPLQTIEVVLGCNHQMDDCLDLHNNIHNFGGQFAIPITNPINKNNHS